MPKEFFCPKTNFTKQTSFKGLSAYAMAMVAPAPLFYSMPLYKKFSYPAAIDTTGGGIQYLDNKSRMISTSQMIIVADSSFFRNGYIQSTSLLSYPDSDSRGLVFPRHNGRANLLYASGNVGSKAGDDLFTDTYIAFNRGSTATSANYLTGNPHAAQINYYFQEEGWLGKTFDENVVVKP